MMLPKGHSCTISAPLGPLLQSGNLEGKRPYTPAGGPSTDASPGVRWGWWVVTGESRGLLGGAGAPYLAVGRRGGLRVQLPAASKERKREKGEDKAETTAGPHPRDTPGPVSQHPVQDTAWNPRVLARD